MRAHWAEESAPQRAQARGAAGVRAKLRMRAKGVADCRARAFKAGRGGAGRALWAAGEAHVLPPGVGSAQTRGQCLHAHLPQPAATRMGLDPPPSFASPNACSAGTESDRAFTHSFLGSFIQARSLSTNEVPGSGTRAEAAEMDTIR